MLGFFYQKAFKLKEDIRIFTDESKTTELLNIQARQIVDFAAAYDVVDSTEGRKVGGARRKGWSSIVRDSWKPLDEHDREIATLQEDSVMMALLRRFLPNLIPQRFHLQTTDGRHQAEMRVRFNPFVHKLDVEIALDCAIDRRWFSPRRSCSPPLKAASRAARSRRHLLAAVFRRAPLLASHR